MRIGTQALPRVDAALQGGAANAGQAGMEGAFAQLMMQLFGSAEGEVLLPQQTLPAKDGKENTAAMQMMAELFAANGLLAWNGLPASDGSLPDTAALIAGDASGLLGGAPLEGGAPAAQLLAALNMREMPAEQAPQGAQNARADFAEFVSGNGGAEGVPVVVEKGASSEESALFDGQMQFRQSVAEARNALKKETVPSGAEPVDIDAIQRKVNAERPNMASSLREKSYDLQQRGNVVSQMKTHILQNLSEGNEEFTVKLKPESLGEITVKLLKGGDGKLSMSIVTASVQTAKLLNESVDALKSSLRPLQAEVREIVPRAEQPSDTQQGGFFSGGFESFQRQQQFAQREQPQYYSGPAYGQNGGPEENEAEPETANSPELLNAYI